MKEFLQTPYEGEKPYIFISYCHRDSELVFPVLEYLCGQGYRIWFDRGIHPGEEWQDVIADHLADSTLFLAFISKEYVESHNCRRELNFAVSENKSILPIILEEVTLTSAMKMQLASVQAISYYEHNSEEAFYRDFEKMPLLKGLNDELDQEEAGKVDNKQEKETVEQKEKTKKKSRKGLLIAVIVLVLSAVAGIVFWSGHKKKDYDPKTMYKVTLTAEEMSVKEFNAAVEVLKGRLDVLTDGEEYQIQVSENTVKLLLPKKSFAGMEPERIMRGYITRAIDLYVIDAETAYMSNTENVSIDRDDLASVTLKEGTLDEIGKEELKALGIEKTPYKYIEVVLNDTCLKRIGDKIGAWKNGLVFAQDIEQDEFYYHTTYSAGDGKTFYIVNKNQEGRFSELIEYNFTHDSLAEGFYFEFALDDIDWEVAEKQEHPGKNQCDADEVSGKTVTLTYETYSGKIDDAKLPYADAVFKDSLDALSVPYAFGHRENEEQTEIAIKIGMEHMGFPILNILGKSAQCSLRFGATSRYVNVNDCEIALKELKDGTYGFELIFADNQKDKLEEITKEMVENDLSTLYFGIYGMGGFSLFSAEVDAAITDGKIVFDRSCFTEKEEITEDMVWIIDFLKVLGKNDVNPFNFVNGKLQYNEDENGVQATWEDFGVSNEIAQQKMRQAVKTVSKDAQVEFSVDNKVYVVLNLEVNEMLPEESARLVKDLYHASDFEESPFEDIVFFLVKEDEITNERARITISKRYGIESGTIVCNGIFSGGRLDRYRESFMKIMAEDPFYKELVTDLTLWE